MAIQPSDTGQLDTSVYAEGAHGFIGVSEAPVPAGPAPPLTFTCSSASKRKRRPACIQLTQQTRGALFIGVQIVSLFARLRPQLTTPPRSECGCSPVDLLRASF
jgi:hypothetical protein